MIERGWACTRAAEHAVADIVERTDGVTASVLTELLPRGMLESLHEDGSDSSLMTSVTDKGESEGRGPVAASQPTASAMRRTVSANRSGAVAKFKRTKPAPAGP